VYGVSNLGELFPIFSLDEINEMEKKERKKNFIYNGIRHGDQWYIPRPKSQKYQ
jgi:hypothetical protein